MSTIRFADIVHESIAFDTKDPTERLILELIDSPWVQRLRDISQTASTRLVFMFSEHSRFGHSLGVAYLAKVLLDRLAQEFKPQVESYRPAILVAALLHDIGHLAPGSHSAYRAWYPHSADEHEKVSQRIIMEDEHLASSLLKFDSQLLQQVCNVLKEDPSLPAWTWQIISGGGWNIDRGNWCIVDSILAGVGYGRYNITALLDSISISPDQQLVLLENRLDAMTHFAVSRHAMYQQIYQHRVLLAADMLCRAIVQRARDLGKAIPFADPHMLSALNSQSIFDLGTSDIFSMREHWWRYHLSKWRDSNDLILRDLSDRIYNRRLFKTVKIREIEDADALLKAAKSAVEKAGFDPKYYLHTISTTDTLTNDFKQSIQVLTDDSKQKQLLEAEFLFSSLAGQEKSAAKQWLAMPEQAKNLLGRSR